MRKRRAMIQNVPTDARSTLFQSLPSIPRCATSSADSSARKSLLPRRQNHDAPPADALNRRANALNRPRASPARERRAPHEPIRIVFHAENEPNENDPNEVRAHPRDSTSQGAYVDANASDPVPSCATCHLSLHTGRRSSSWTAGPYDVEMATDCSASGMCRFICRGRYIWFEQSGDIQTKQRQERSYSYH